MYSSVKNQRQVSTEMSIKVSNKPGSTALSRPQTGRLGTASVLGIATNLLIYFYIYVPFKKKDPLHSTCASLTSCELSRPNHPPIGPAAMTRPAAVKLVQICKCAWCGGRRRPSTSRLQCSNGKRCSRPAAEEADTSTNCACCKRRDRSVVRARLSSSAVPLSPSGALLIVRATDAEIPYSGIDQRPRCQSSDLMPLVVSH